jgi:hypothetical protein
MPRAHRWNPEKIVAFHTIVKNEQEAKDDDDENSSSSAVVVFCPYAAKGSQNAAVAEKRAEEKNQNSSSIKRNTNDIVTATVFWLVNADINRVIGRLEKEGLVQVLDELLNKNDVTKEILQPLHLQSHKEYRELILANLKTEGQKQFFVNEFVENPEKEKRKFGNQAVGHELDLKCAHALTAQYLAGVTCPLGELVANFIIFIGETKALVQTSKGKNDENQNDDDYDGNEEELDWRSNLIPLFKQFVANYFSSKKKDTFSGKFSSSNSNSDNNNIVLASNDVTRIVASAKAIVEAFAEKGEGKGRRRKRRTD